jgi:hypothetical protein
MNNYLHKISIIFVFLCFASFLLHNKTFLENTDIQEQFITEYKTVEDVKSNNETILSSDINQNKDVLNYEKKYCENKSENIQEITNTNKNLKIDKKFQTYGPTNYQDPNDMGQEQRLSFKYSYPNNMTLQDYVNWLMLYKDEQKNISKEHVVNLQKLLIGEKLEYIAGILPPSTKTSPPLTSEDYFNNLYITDTFIKNPRTFNITNSSSGNMIAYNYGQYPDFKKNFDVYGISGRYDLNPDLFKKKELKNFQSFMLH